MKLVIEMPEIAYKRLLEEQHLPNRIDLEYFIVHGTPLPKGHWIEDKCHYCEHNFTPYKGNTGEFEPQESEG